MAICTPQSVCLSIEGVLHLSLIIDTKLSGVDSNIEKSELNKRMFIKNYMNLKNRNFLQKCVKLEIMKVKYFWS